MVWQRNATRATRDDFVLTVDLIDGMVGIVNVMATCLRGRKGPAATWVGGVAPSRTFESCCRHSWCVVSITRVTSKRMFTSSRS